MSYLLSDKEAEDLMERALSIASKIINKDYHPDPRLPEAGRWRADAIPILAAEIFARLKK